MYRPEGARQTPSGIPKRDLAALGILSEMPKGLEISILLWAGVALKFLMSLDFRHKKDVLGRGNLN
jgi:hypothetical protein